MIFDELIKSKDEIENKMGRALEWRRMDDSRSSNILYENFGMDVYQPMEWPKIAEFLIEEMNKMEQAFKPYLRTISLKVKDKGSNL